MSDAGRGYGEGFFYTPEDQAAQQAIRRRQAYAQALMQGKQHQGQYGGLADAGNSIAGALMAKRADKDATSLATQTQTKYAADLANLLKGGSGPSPQISNTAGSPQEMDPEGNPMAAQGPQLDPEGNPMASQAPAQGQPQSFAQRIAASGNPALMYQFGPQALQAQMQNEMTRGNKLWENDLPQSRASREQGAMSLQNQEDAAKFNNQLPMNAAQLATDQRAGASQAETARHDKAVEYAALHPFGAGIGNGQDGLPATGQPFLDQLSKQNPGLAAQVKAIGTYRQAGQNRGTKQGNALMGLVNQAYPSYDSTQFDSKHKARNDFTTGKNGNTVRSLNVAVQHLDQLGQLSEAMGNGDVQLVNKIGNYFATQTGQPAPSNFNAAKQLVGDEIVKAIVGAGGGVSDREEAAHNISAASSPQQLAGVIQTYQGLLSGQLSGLKQQYEKSTGLGDFEDYLAPETKAKLQAHAQGSQAAPQPPKKTVKFSDLP